MAVSPQGFCETPPGSRYPLLPGIRSRMVRTSRLRQHIYESGPATGETLVLIHGNMASGRFFEELMAALEDSWTKYKTTMSIRDLPETPGP